MTKSKYNFSKILLIFLISFFSLAFINSSFFKINEIKCDCIDFHLEKDAKKILKNFKQKNLLFVNLNDIKESFKNFPFLEIESFEKILPDKLLIKFKIKEELGTLINELGTFDLYEGGFIFPRFKNEPEKMIIEGNFSKENLQILSEVLSKNKFIYDDFLSIKICDGGILRFMNKDGLNVEILNYENLNFLKKINKLNKECSYVANRNQISMINLNIFISPK